LLPPDERAPLTRRRRSDLGDDLAPSGGEVGWLYSRVMASEDFYVVTVEYDPEREALNIYGDAAGLLDLAETLRRLVATTQPGEMEHIHLMSPSWGGSSLADEQQSAGGQVVRHLKVCCWRTP
jgi:hypothetical protein